MKIKNFKSFLTNYFFLILSVIYSVFGCMYCFAIVEAEDIRLFHKGYKDSKVNVNTSDIFADNSVNAGLKSATAKIINSWQAQEKTANSFASTITLVDDFGKEHSFRPTADFIYSSPSQHKSRLKVISWEVMYNPQTNLRGQLGIKQNFQHFMDSTFGAKWLPFAKASYLKPDQNKKLKFKHNPPKNKNKKNSKKHKPMPKKNKKHRK